jgi:hypothetical protein
VEAAAAADPALPPEEENGWEVVPSPSELGCTSKELKENECVTIVKSTAEEVL